MSIFAVILHLILLGISLMATMEDYMSEQQKNKKRELTPEQKEECLRLNAIYELRKSDLKLTQAKVSEDLGVNQSAVSHYLNGTNALNVNTASKFAKLLNVTVDKFSPRLAEEIKQMADTLDPQKMDLEGAIKAIDKKAVKVPLLDIYAAASPSGIINKDYPEVIREISIDKDQVSQLLGRRVVDGIKLINVPTDSMTPTINKGDVAFIDITCVDYVGEGVYIFIDEDGALFIKRLQKVPNAGYKILSDNKDYLPLDFTQEQLSRCKIMGKFIKALPLKMIDL